MRVLVADDDPTYRSLLADMLTKWNFEPEVVSDGVEALAVMETANPPLLVILDWEMPRVDGFEAARTIRNDLSGQDAYILIITGSRKKQDIMQVLVCGADDFLIKPFEPMDLKIHLRSAMRILHLREELDKLKIAVQRDSGPVGWRPA